MVESVNSGGHPAISPPYRFSKEDNMAGKENNSEPQKSEPIHQPFQRAHEAYIKVVDEAWLQAQRECHNNQLTYQEHLARLQRATTPDEYKEAQENLQKTMSAAPSEPTLSKAVGDACAQYKNAIRAAVTETNIDDLDPTTLSAIGQSLCAVAQMTHQATLCVPPAKTP
jgi:hypothetical protein